MRYKPVTFALILAGGLAACGDTTTEQAIYGGAAGAGAAAVLDGSLLTGAAVGAVGNILYCEENPGEC